MNAFLHLHLEMESEIAVSVGSFLVQFLKS